MSALISSALIDDDHAEFRHWSFSAMLAVALHGAVAMAVLAWHATSRPFDASGSSAVGALFIDLAPLPAARSPEQNLPPLEARGTAARERENDVAEAASAANRDSGAEPLGLERSVARPGANAPGVDAPIAPLPQESTARDSDSGGAAASHAFAAGAVEKSPGEVSHGLRVDPGPLDTSITVTHPLYPHKSFSVFDRNRTILLRPVKHPGSHSSLSRAPGAHIEDRVNAAIERDVLHRMERARNAGTVSGTNSLGIKNGSSGSAPGSVHGNATGAANANGNMGDAKAGVINGTARNAVGLTVPVHPSAHVLSIDAPREGIAAQKAREGISGLKAGPSLSSTGAMAAVSPPGIFNGHGTPRPGTSLTTLGGPPKTNPGMLSGSDFHPKHQQ